MVKFQDKKDGSQEEKMAVMAFRPMMEVISGHRQLKTKENPYLGNNEAPVLKRSE